MIIRAENISLFYQLQKKSKFSLKEGFTGFNPFKNKNSQSGSKSDSQKGIFWALKDISFEAKDGDVIGLVGRNGAGKSTLLRVLADILKPDLGSLNVEGTVSSLLSLNTGQQMNLTGRENIVLSGLLLGLSKSYIYQCMDDIIAFSELGQFIDQPIKSYSSGMKSRLSFALMPFVKNDILLLDEIFSVGDGNFKEKAKKVMNNHVAEAKVVFLVSHSLGLIKDTCNKVMWLDNGRLLEFGDSEVILAQYDAFLSKSSKSVPKVA